MSIFQLILGLIALFYLVNGFRHFLRREKSQTFFKFFLTVIIWSAVLLFAVFPSTSHQLSRELGLGSNLNTLIFIGFVLVFIIFFKLLSIIERLERNISDIVRNEALEVISNKRI
jgi:hypothetical protein